MQTNMTCWFQYVSALICEAQQKQRHIQKFQNLLSLIQHPKLKKTMKHNQIRPKT